MLLFFIPRRIHMIVLGYLLVDLLRLLGIYLLDELSGNSGVDAARLDDRLASDYGSSKNDRARACCSVIQSHRAHSDQGAIANLRPVDRYVMADGYIIADLDRRFLI